MALLATQLSKIFSVNAARRVASDFCGVPENINNCNCSQNDPYGKTKLNAGEQRQTKDHLPDAKGRGVDKASGKANTQT